MKWLTKSCSNLSGQHFSTVLYSHNHATSSAYLTNKEADDKITADRGSIATFIGAVIDYDMECAACKQRKWPDR